MKIRLLIYFVFVGIIITASCKQSSSLEQALQLAGKNRPELETVLNHYRQNPADSLKYRAARFLIENMSIHYYLRETPEYYEILDSLNQSDLSSKEVYAHFDSIKIKTSVPKEEWDLKTLSSEFLIRHINSSFDNWGKAPWKDKVGFEDFCEYILPYAVSHEKRELWTDYYRNKYLSYISEYLHNTDSSKVDLIDVCDILNDSLISTKRLTLHFGHSQNYPPVMADHIRSGICDVYIARTIYLMRSLGIPTGSDFAPQWASFHMPHSWNTLLTDDGKHHPFMGFEHNLKQWEVNTTFECPKIYRNTFGISKNSLAARYPKESIPGFLAQPNVYDVTHEYITVSDVTINVNRPKGVRSKIAYLYVFNNITWIPVHWGVVTGNSVTFTDMGRKVVYLPTFYDGQKFIAASDPFLIDSLGSVVPIKPHPTKKETMILERKFRPHRTYRYYDRMLNGRFQGANSADFRDAKDLYRIEQNPILSFNTVNINNESMFRYVRYIGRPGTFSNVAELEFYSKEDGEYKQLSGDIIGTEGVYEENKGKEVVFDKDGLTYFKAVTDSGGWIGLDFGKPQKIDRIRFLPRNDDNNIRQGDQYELFYWDEGKWNSLGRKTGEDLTLVYDNCPVGALYLLHNHTRGKEERIFTYENGTQVWW
jgi:hypothetical protein